MCTFRVTIATEDVLQDSDENNNIHETSFLDGSFLSGGSEEQVITYSQCGICVKNFKNKRSLDRHVKEHDPKYEYKCLKCSKYFTEKSEFNKHISEKHQRHLCLLCGKTYSSKYNLEAHAFVHGSISLSKCLRCSYEDCNRTFRGRSAYEYHIHKHYGIRPYKCRNCGTEYGNEDVKRRHEQACVDAQSILCNICGKKIQH